MRAAIPDLQPENGWFELSEELRFGPFRATSVRKTAGPWLIARCRGEDGSEVVVKTPRSPTTEAQQLLRAESDFLTRLRSGPRNACPELVARSGADEVAWFASRFVPKPTLASRRSTWPVTVAELTQFGASLAHALSYVHSHGIVHGDVSPTNVLIDEAGEATLIDFGAAALVFEGRAVREVGHAGRQRLGTPGYMAPERIAHGTADTRSDLYALGCLLYEVATGRPPFHADDGASLSRQHLELIVPAPSLLRADLPAALDDVILALLAKDPARRPASASHVERVLRGVAGGASTPAGKVEAEGHRLRSPRLVGREAVLQKITEALEWSGEGRAGLMLVSGESGIGKTRLLSEAAEQARERGFRAIFGSCDDALPAPLASFRPVLSWAADSARSGMGSENAELCGALAVLAAYEPTLAGFAASAPPVELPPALARARVLLSLAKVLAALAREQPLFVLVDDIQWADDLSLAFLSGDHRSSFEGLALCVVAAFRADEIAREQRQRLEARATTLIQLERLEVEHASRLIGQLLGGRAVSAELAELLHHYSSGNPFLIVEYLHAVLERERTASAVDPSDASASAALALPIQLPASLGELFATRVRPLSRAARDLLELGAILGVEFPRTLLEALAERLALTVPPPALEELVQRRLLDAKADDRLRWVHDKLREAQLAGLNMERRRTIHALTATLLDSSSVWPSSATELGLHYAAAEQPARAVPHLEAAALQAAARYAHVEAIELYTRALEQLRLLSKTAGAPGPADLARLAEGRADALFRSGRNREAEAQFGEAAALGTGIARARLERKRAAALWTAHDYDAAAVHLDIAEQALGPLETGDDPQRPHEWIEIQQGRFWLHYFARRAGALTEDLIRRMGDVVERVGSPLQRSMFFECKASHLMAERRYLHSADAVAAARRGVSELGGQLAHAGLSGSARFVLAFSLVLGDRDDCAEAVELFRSNLQELEPVGDATLSCRSLVYLGIAQRRLGLAEPLRDVASRTKSYAERAQLGPYVGAALAFEAWLAKHDGEPETAEPLAREALRVWREGSHLFPFRWLASFILLELDFLRDDFDAAQGNLADLLDPGQKCFASELGTALEDARTACTAAEPREASRKLQTVLQLAQEAAYL